ncbi:coiled-coil domain-containing protein 40-like isoform X1 [Anguilla anguilla]|uniref:coiled-coil domain-containing protein 40-like isoform X1 n=1 Tax=Anguilla anguilla TaxID=7936 RepID=UPI0015A9C429|nr:coiled-coil domain-containing protein 40-like isoform X1 [Anguilla anguilla]
MDDTGSISPSQDEPETSGAVSEADQPAESGGDPEDGGSGENGEGAEGAGNGESDRAVTQETDEDVVAETKEGAVGERRDEMVGDMEEELLVLDPEHPLMKGFQAALKTHLEKQLERLENELRELRSMERAEGDGRVEVGTALYKVQEELGRVDARLQGQNKANAATSSQRQKAQDRLEDVRRDYRATVAQNKQLWAQVSQMQAEVDTMALRLLYLHGASEDMCSDLATTQTCTRKAQVEKNRAAQEKNTQDLYVDRLTQKLERLQEQTALYNARASAQAMETQVAQEGLSEAQMELDALLVEQKQLLQQWNISLLGVRRRDEAYNAMLDALRVARDQARALDTEIEGFRKSIGQEEEQNEQLTVALNSARLDCGTSRKLIARSKTQEEALLAQHATYTRMLQESEHMLEQVTVDCAARRAEAAALRALIDREVGVRRELEEKIMGKMQEQLSHGQAAKYSRQQVEKIATQKKERELQVALLEDDIAQVTLESTEVKLRAESLSRVWAELQKEMAHQQELLAHSEAEISKQDIIIERKQFAIGNYNKKIEDMCTKHEDVGGLEIRVHKLRKELEEMEAEIQGQQQSWLRQQEELVKLNQDRQTQSAALLTLQGKLTILQQKKVHTEGEIQQERREQAEVERHMNGLMLDIVKLNGLLSKNSQQSEALEHRNCLMESDFISRLKDSEREAIELQMNLERIQEEKDMLLNSLLEAERQVLLWEKKTQLVKETQLAVREEMGQGDVRFLKSEIHRMEVRYDQLMKQQARLLRELDAAVARREAIEMHCETQARSARTRPAHTESHSVLQGLRRKIQDCQKKCKECEGVVVELQDTQRGLRSTLSQKQKQLAELRSTCDTVDTELRSLQDAKEKNRSRLITLQGRVRHLQAVRDGRYRSVCVGGTAPGSTAQRLSAHLQAVDSILQCVYQNCPEHRGALHLLTLAFASRRELLDPAPRS